MKKRIIYIIVLMGVLIAGFVYLNKVFASSHFYVNTTEDFIELANKTDIDVVFYGSSHFYTAFNPLIINKKCDIISYNLASDALLLPVTDLVLNESLNYTKPKLIILEVYGQGFGNPKTKSQKGYQLRALDFVSNFSIKKIIRVGKLYNKNEFLGAFSPFIRNHTEWNNRDYFDFNKRVITNGKREFYYNGYIGYKTKIKESEKYKGFQNILIERDSTENILNNNTKKSLDNFIDIAKQNKIEVLLVYTPDLRARSWNYSLFDELERFADSKDIGFLNLNDYYSVMKLEVLDFMDPSHLNTNGSIKTSNFLADYLNENYNFSNRSSEKIFREQTEGYDAFITEYKFIEPIYYHRIVAKSLLDNLIVKDVNILKEEKHKLLFDITLDGNLRKPHTIENFVLAVHIFPEKSDLSLMNQRSKDRKRIYEVHEYLFEKGTNAINVEFDSNIINIDKLELFLYDKSGFAGVVGNKVIIEQLECNEID